MTQYEERQPSSGRAQGAKRTPRRSSRAELRFLGGLIGFVAIVGALAGAGCGSSSSSEATATAQASLASTPTLEPTPIKINIDTGNNPSQGPADAKVTIIEFADFQGLKCASFALTTLPQIMANYGDTVRFVFLNLLLTAGDQFSEEAAEAGECAYEQAALWPFHNMVFQNQSVFTTATDVASFVDSLKGFAAQLGLDTARFNDCLDSGRMASAVQADQQVAQKAVNDAQLTDFTLPAFFINGRYLGGAKSYDTFVQAIEYVLSVDK